MSIIDSIDEHEKVVEEFKKQCISTVTKISQICASALKVGNKILLCGNGGSAADCQHIAAELVGRFLKERHSLPAIALTVDTSILTAVGNDYGYSKVFERQVEGLGTPGDVLIGISTSGNSENIINALNLAKRKGLYTIAFTGYKDSKSSMIADFTLQVPSTVTARIQECHILSGHLICEYIDQYFD